MDINAKTQNVNTFAKGMNADISDAFMETDQYRLANNLHYVTNNEENTGELHVIEGAKKVLDNIQGVVRGMMSIRNYGVIITEQTDGSWRVFRWNSDINELTKIADISDHDLSKNKLSLVTKYEDDKNIKVYIADGENPIAVVNIMSDDVITDYNKITSYPQVVLAPPVFESLIDGTLKEGVVQYSYQYYNTWGTATDASIPTRLIPLHNKDTKLTNTSNFKGVEQGKVSNKGVRISIPVNKSFEKIRVFRITYVEAGQQPLIELILDTTVNVGSDDAYYTVNDTGFEALQVYSLEEYNGIAGIHIIPRVIESKDEYMFAAQIKTQQSEFDKLFDVDKFKAEQNDDGLDIYDLNTPYTINTLGAWHKFDDSSYVSWRFEITELVADENGNNQELIKLPANIDEATEDPKNVYNYTSLRRDELYRFGIVLYNNKGGHSSVFWIADVRTPSVYSDGAHTFDIKDDGKLYVYPLGIEFQVNIDRINNDISNSGYQITGWEIVRCNRTEKDIATIAQGVLSRPGKRIYVPGSNSADQNYPLTPTGWLTTAKFVSVTPGKATSIIFQRGHYYYSNDDNDSVFQFVCPEYCYAEESFKALLDNDSFYIKALSYLYGTILGQNDVNEPLNISWKYPDAEGDTAHITASNVIHPGNKYTRIIFDNPYIAHHPQYQTTIHYLPIGETESNSIAHFDSCNKNYRHQYIKLYNKLQTVKNIQTNNRFDIKELPNVDVLDTSTAEAMNWNDLAETTSSTSNGEAVYPLKYTNHISNIGDDSFVNWVSTCLYNVPVNQSPIDDYFLTHNVMDDRMDSSLSAVLGPGGKTVLLKFDKPHEGYLYNRTVCSVDNNKNTVCGTFLCNLRKNVIPYGGHTEESKKLSTYYSYGYYADSNNRIQHVYGGDCFIQPFEYVSMHKYYHPQIKRPRNACIVYAIPVETNINLAYTHGYEFSKRYTKSGNATNLQDKPNDVNGFFIQDEPLYAYNGAYGSSNKLQLFAAYQNDPSTIENEDYRCYYSNPKDNNESIDNWTIYQPANFLDVDTRRGPITGLRTFHNSLVFWQRDATGLFSVNERTTITDNSNMPLLLGTGGVLARYDYINTSNGMKDNEFADTQSDSTLYWWDHNKRDICAYAGGQEMVVLSKVKSVSNFLNRQENLSETPALTFDKKYNEMIASVSNGKDNDAGSLVYSEQTQQFIGLYGINHMYDLLFADKLYLLTNCGDSNCGLYKWNTEDNGCCGIQGEKLYPYLKYVVNSNPQFNKVFDNVTFGARVYGGGSMQDGKRINEPLHDLQFTFATPLKQYSELDGKLIENVEYDYRFAIPRNNDSEYGDRMRGKTMQCELKSNNNSLDFSIQYITTKYRISWS